MTDTTFPPKPDHTLMKVMIVDDMPQVRRDLRQLLEITGLFEIVAETGDSQEATRLAQELLPDVVMIDLEMAGLDGYELTHQIKLQNPSIRVVILSAYGGPYEIERAQDVGADEFLVKGVHYEILVNAILGGEPPTSPKYSKKGE
jgi:DNA-binding NarL/FixJ family response regulator